MKIRTALGPLVLAPALLVSSAWSIAQDRVSAPGKYSGYSPVLYDGTVRTSQYVAVRDGTRIAVDIIRPTLGGQVVTTPLPVIWANNPYNRRSASDTNALAQYGYVIVAADMRGNYASYGIAVNTNRAEWTTTPAQAAGYWDAYDITEWLAQQPWSTGNVGMYGCSAVGNSTMQAPATQAPHLKAIFPMSPAPEYYDWGGVTAMFSTLPTLPAYPSATPPSADSAAVAVDADTDGSQLAAAKDQHRYNVPGPGWVPYRDSVAPQIQADLGTSVPWWNATSIYPHLADISRTNIPIYQTVNMLGDDMRTKLGNVVKINNLTNPMKSLFAPGGHCSFWNGTGTPVYPYTFDVIAEQHRFFDRWLKGIDNGITNEPPIYYYIYNAPTQSQDYRFAWQWPLPTESRVSYYLSSTPSDTVSSGVNNGSLSLQAPLVAAPALRSVRAAAASPASPDIYTVDYTAVSAKSGSSGDNSNAKGMTYTTTALASDTKLIGSPIIHLWISSTATDNDFIANVWDVAPDGTATKIPGSFDGMLRASHRLLSKPPYAKDMGLPYHESFAKDIQPLTAGQPTELVFDEAPMAYTFKAGHRIRLVIICNGAKQDGDQFSNPPTPVLSPAPLVSFYHDVAHPSLISLPVSAPIPVTPQVQVLTRTSQIVAKVTFPSTVDTRYLSDVVASSVKLNGVVADAVVAQGNQIVATFRGGALLTALQRGDAMTIAGTLGSKYYYGEETAFSDTRSYAP